jgi:probable HAF family extracellular repeat protein
MLAVLALRFGVPLPGKAAGLGHYVLTDLGMTNKKESVAHSGELARATSQGGHNRRGQKLGRRYLPGNYGVHAVLIDHGRSRDLGTLGGKESAAVALNDAGEVIGYSARADRSLHAFLWQEGKMLDLGTLGGRNSWAWDLDSRGRIVGEADTSSGATQAYLYDRGILTDLGTLGGGESAARGINERGQIVGEAETARGDLHAFLYSGGMMSDLNLQTDLPKDWTLTSATRIDETGRIWGEALCHGIEHLFVLTPVRS